MRHMRHRYDPAVRGTKPCGGQALVELSIWGTIILMIASVFVSYVLVLVYRQDLMIRNFVETVKFAASAGTTGAPVMQIAIEHRRVPSLLNIFFPAYREIRDTASAIWSWNMFWKEHDDDPDQPATLVKIIMDGKNVSRQLVGLPPPNIAGLLPSDLRGREGQFLVLSVSPDEEIANREGKILERIEDDFGADSYVYQRVRHWLEQWDGVQRSFANLSPGERQHQLQKLKDVLYSAYGSYVPGEISSLINYLEHESWRGDLDSLSGLFRNNYVERDKRSAEIVVNGDHGRLRITGPYTIHRDVESRTGTKSYEWSSGDESFSW